MFTSVRLHQLSSRQVSSLKIVNLRRISRRSTTVNEVRGAYINIFREIFSALMPQATFSEFPRLWANCKVCMAHSKDNLEVFGLLGQRTLSPHPPEYRAFMGSAVMVVMADRSRDQIWMRPVYNIRLGRKLCL